MASEWQQLELRLPIVREAEPTPPVQRRPAVSPAVVRRDPSTMTNTELLAALLGPSPEPLCAELAATYRTFRDLASLHPADLRDRELTAGAIDKLGAVFEIAPPRPSSSCTTTLVATQLRAGEDLEITRRLREVGEIIGVRVLDHIVIGKGRYVSFVDDGYW